MNEQYATTVVPSDFDKMQVPYDDMNVDRKIICLFYNSVISSVLTYAISTWFKACSEKLHGLMNKSRKRVCKIVGSQYHCFIDKPDFLYDKKCMSLVGKIIKDCLHPLHMFSNFYPMAKDLECNIAEL